MKLKHKLFMDGIILILLIFVMSYSLTGNLIHEILGLVILAGFIIHMAVNNQYYMSMVTALRTGQVSSKSTIAFIINILLPVDAIILLISSFAISKDLFPGIAEIFSKSIWTPIHVISSVLLVILVFIHVFMHLGLFRQLLGKATDTLQTKRMKTAALRVIAIIFAVIVIRSSYTNTLHAADMIVSVSSGSSDPDQNNNQENEYIINNEDDNQDSGDAQNNGETQDDENTQNDDQLNNDTESDNDSDDSQSLDDYLGSLVCTACGRQCSLLSPQCGRGQQQAEQAISDYNETYTEQSI